jgi:hypothetical protein
MASGLRDPARERQWRRRVKDWEASGLSVRAFCRQHGLVETSFYYWKRELRSRDAATASARTKPVFVPMTVLPGSTLAVEVRCPSGHVVLLSVGDTASLAPLFEALTPLAAETRPC